MKALAEKYPDAVVTLSATVSEQEAVTKADVEESISVAMRMFQDQTYCNKYCTCLAEMVEGLEYDRGVWVGAHEQRASC